MALALALVAIAVLMILLGVFIEAAKWLIIAGIVVLAVSLLSGLYYRVRVHR